MAMAVFFLKLPGKVGYNAGKEKDFMRIHLAVPRMLKFSEEVMAEGRSANKHVRAHFPEASNEGH